MRLKNFLKKLFIATFVLSFFSLLKIEAADTVSYPSTPLTISISNPMQSQVIVTEGFSVAGKAPAGVLITITIQDEDYAKVFQVHEQNLITNATTTSDRNGDWVYIPSKNLVPGKYSIVAAFQNNTSGSISTDKIFFTVADEAGATSWFAIPGSTFIIVLAFIIIALIIVIFRVTGNKKRRIFLRTSAGDIPVREIVEDNIVEIVPLNEPVINVGMQPAFQVVQQPAIIMPQPVYSLNQPVAVMPQPQIIQPVNTMAPQATMPAQQQLPVQTVQTRPVVPIQTPAPVVQPAQSQVLTNPVPTQNVMSGQQVNSNSIQHPLVQMPVNESQSNLNNPFAKGIANTNLS